MHVFCCFAAHVYELLGNTCVFCCFAGHSVLQGIIICLACLCVYSVVAGHMLTCVFTFQGIRLHMYSVVLHGTSLHMYSIALRGTCLHVLCRGQNIHGPCPEKQDTCKHGTGIF